MTELSTPFSPDWVSPPGETILDLIEERGWTQGELSHRLGYTEKHVSQLINGRVPLTDDAVVDERFKSELSFCGKLGQLAEVKSSWCCPHSMRICWKSPFDFWLPKRAKSGNRSVTLPTSAEEPDEANDRAHEQLAHQLEQLLRHGRDRAGRGGGAGNAKQTLRAFTP